MDHHEARTRRALVGVAAMVLGSAGLVAGLAGTASAHEGTEPEPRDDNPSCLDLADELGVDQEWTEYKIDGFPQEDGDHPYVLSDRGTPEDDSDDAVITLDVFGDKRFNWSSNVGIDAIFVKGGDDAYGSYFYYYGGEELTEDVDYTVPPWGQWHKNSISHITVCWDDEYTPPTTSSTTSTLPPSTSSSTTSSSTTSSTVAPTTSSSSTTVAPTTSQATTTTVASNGGLPVTGSNTGLLAALGGGLLLAGGIFILAKQQLWRRSV